MLLKAMWVFVLFLKVLLPLRGTWFWKNPPVHIFLNASKTENLTLVRNVRDFPEALRSMGK